MKSYILSLLILWAYFINLHESYLPSSQIFALEQLYESLNGKNWSNCHWNFKDLSTNNTLPSYYCGLVISNTTIKNIQTTNKIFFKSDNNLNGTISEYIHMLVDLEVIQIYYNNLLTGVIPHSICNLTHLWAIAFFEDNLSGDVPECIGNMSSIKAILLAKMPLLSISDHIIEALCYTARNINWLQFATINYTGSIPECIGNELDQLQHLEFYDLPRLVSTIPQSLNNLTKINYLQLQLLPNLSGIFPSGVLQNKTLTHLTIRNTSLSGTVSLDLICNTSLAVLLIQTNPLLFIPSIPTCIASLSNLAILSLGGSKSVHGTIPIEICNLSNLKALSISKSAVTGIFPKCIGHIMNLIFLAVGGNELHGTFPAILSKNIQVFDISDNKFSGSVSTIFQLERYSKLEVVSLHGNNFCDDDIGAVIKKIFTYSSNLQAMTIYGNKYIGGKFPEFSEEIYLDKLAVFAIHRCEISGTLPSELHFSHPNISSFVLSVYGNLLSSYLPKELVNANSTTPIVLTGNLFR
eukprot:553030_1